MVAKNFFGVSGWQVGWVGRWSRENCFDLNLYQDNSGVIPFAGAGYL